VLSELPDNGDISNLSVTSGSFYLI